MYEDQPQHNGVRTNPSDHITAAKMREIAENNISLELGIEIQKWLERIQAAANANKFQVVSGETLSDACKKHLESRGFKIAYDPGWSDQRDPKESVAPSTTVYW